MPKYSIIIPVYNRPDELNELLESMRAQTFKDFEIIIVEDGSKVKSDKIVEKFADKLDIKYFYKDNSGPGQSRNYGAERASGDYLIIFDSDCIIPPEYLAIVDKRLSSDFLDCYGGPDKAHPQFTNTQKAINYGMTSFFTTGGIRGGGEKMDKFFPRSFNMGYSKEVFKKTGGYSEMRFGEDIDMSVRILKAGFKTGLIKDAYVYHKRRTDLRKFFKQVYNSGAARINLNLRHPGTLKLVHLLPSAFTLGAIFLLISTIFCHYAILPLVLYAFMIFVDSLIKDKSMPIAFLSVIASFVQLFGYGLGFISSFINRIILRRPEYSAFKKNFYK